VLTPEEALQSLASPPKPRTNGSSNGNGQPEHAAPAPKKKSSRRGLYLKFPTQNSELVTKAEKFLFVFEGDFPVYYYFTDTGKYLQTPCSYWVMPNPVLTRELRRLLGEENVAIIE